jgi:hypothetical protein
MDGGGGHGTHRRRCERIERRRRAARVGLTTIVKWKGNINSKARSGEQSRGQSAAWARGEETRSEKAASLPPGVG